jgi:hypothetical protein
MTLQELQEQALKLSIEERWELVWVVLRSISDQQSWPLQPNPQSTARPTGLAASLIGIVQTDAPPPTDEEVKAVLDEQLVQKYL